uniref:RT_RNaseH_2 domain-containing protein n=1 Tax=Haemonchus placei TaxID=6290 RepID=A0A0N4VUL1_HAEPC
MLTSSLVINTIFGSCTAGKDHIYTMDDPPAKIRPYRVPVKYREKVKKHINLILKAGVMEGFQTHWVHNLVVISKKETSFGYASTRDVQSEKCPKTLPDPCPIPRVDDVLEKISGNILLYYIGSRQRLFATHEEGSYKRGAVTENKIDQMTHLPSDLKLASSYSLRIMSKVLGGLKCNVLTYIDDTLHLIDKDPYSPAEGSTRAVREFPTPTNTKEVKRFLGTVGFSRKFIPNSANKAEPLTRLTTKATNSNGYFNYNKPFHIFTNASSVAQAGALMQEEQHGSNKFYAIAYCSRTLRETERRWPAAHIELGAVAELFSLPLNEVCTQALLGRRFGGVSFGILPTKFLRG